MPLHLYNFQKQDIIKLRGVPKGLNANDMGTGKTVEAIIVDREKRNKHGEEFRKKGKIMTLVVAPLSVIGSWVEHFQTWQPHLKLVVINTKKRADFGQAVLKGKGDVFICHWDGLRLMPELKRVYWFHVIADEVHRAKNRDALQTQALKRLSTAHKLGLSGTPADNRPDDFWSVLNWIDAAQFSSFWSFEKRYVKKRAHNVGACELEDCDGYHKRAYKEILGCDNVDELHAKIGSFYVRRTKEEVLPELPEKYYTSVYIDLAPVQARAYNQMKTDMLAWVGKNEDQPIAAPIVISKLVRLQQFACAFGEMVTKVKRFRCPDWPNKCMCDEELLQGKWHTKIVDELVLTEPSSKLDAAMELIQDNPKKQIGFFAQSRQVIELLERRLIKANISSAILTGNTQPEDRTGIISEFQRGKRRIFAGTYAAGGVGITLTAASTVGRIDRPWSPSVDRQAVDRFHRIGQQNAVQVIDFIANGTIDAKRNDKIDWKWSVLREMLGDK